MSVGTFDAFLGQATQSLPFVSSAATIRSNQRIELGLLDGEQHADVERLRDLRQHLRALGHGGQESIEPVGRVHQEDARAVPDAELLRERRARVVLVIVRQWMLLRDGTLVAGDGTSCHHRVVTGTLYLVGTPIGNLGDLAPRAVETLATVDLIAAEDTRRTGRLLAHLQLVDRPLLSFFEGNERERTEEVLRRLRDGATVALVTDGGMPTVSDPGFRLVRACAAEGIDVRVVPGPSAAIAALAISGLPTDRFVFEGFLPRKAGERRARLQALASDPRTIVLFESPKRVRATLVEALDVLGDRPAAVARELTKLHEEVLRGRLSELPEMLDAATLKGEIVVVIGGADATAAPDAGELVEEARALMAEGTRARDAAKAVAKRHGASANEIYRALIGAPSN